MDGVKILRNILLISIFVFLVFFQITTHDRLANKIDLPKSSPSPLPARVIVSPEEIAEKINTDTMVFRAENNLSNLEDSSVACEFATTRLSQMHEEFSHRLFHVQSSDFMFKNKLMSIGENLYEGPVFDDKHIFNMWLDSPTHRDNLEKKYTNDCVLCDNSFCVHVFIQK